MADLDLDIGDGELLAVVGPSGCGKSTVLRIVAGLETPTSGEVSIDGQVVTDSAPGDRDLAFVFQDYALYPHLNAYQNMAFALKSRRMGRKAIDRRVREVAALLGIESLLHRRPRALSGGERQGVAMGRAIVRKPFGPAVAPPRGRRGQDGGSLQQLSASQSGICSSYGSGPVSVGRAWPAHKARLRGLRRDNGETRAQTSCVTGRFGEARAPTRWRGLGARRRTGH